VERGLGFLLGGKRTGSFPKKILSRMTVHYHKNISSGTSTSNSSFESTTSHTGILTLTGRARPGSVTFVHINK